MTIQSETIFQWGVTLVIGVLTWLGSLAVRNNRERFDQVNRRAAELEVRVEKIGDRLNDKLPEALQELQGQITKLEGEISRANTKVDLISSSVIDRVDKLEKTLPALIEGVLYKMLATGKFSMAAGAQLRNDSND